MKIISALLLASGLFFNNAVECDLNNEISTSDVEEQTSENVENSGVTATDTPVTSEEVVITEEEKNELLQFLEQWVNGEIELDEATAQMIKEKLAPVLEDNIDKLLANYIEESEERQKVTAVIMAVLGALASFLVMLIFTKGIKKNNLTATINNETFSKSSKVIESSIAESKKDIKKLYEIIDSNKELNDKTQQVVMQMTESFEKQINAIMGVLKITYKEGEVNGTTQEKESD